ncbi:MAG: acetyltransferase [Desulfobulbaceae bacterium]|nr:acetyltransferase [Desulfobulbaceae bacterium]
MNCIDVFNGDADGICALQQLRLLHPQPGARLITGVKRDVALLSRLAGTTASRITVLDISLDRNRVALEELLANRNSVFYADHHYSGAIPDSVFLEAYIDPSPLLCTALIIDRLLAGKFRPWAIAGAFGDNLDEVAIGHAEALGLTGDDITILRETGRLLNYNGYGLSVDDLLIHPADLFGEVHQYADPFSLHRDSTILRKLRGGYEQDMAKAAKIQPFRIYPAGRVFQFPQESWSNRVIGVFSNQVARDQPEMAHATVLTNPDGSLMVSVRAPLTTRRGADTLCRQFASGGGRAAAAGINQLPAAELETFLSRFAQFFSPSNGSLGLL